MTRLQRERGSSGVQMAAGVLPLLALLVLVVAMFRAGRANMSVDAAAYDAARAASIARTADQAQADAARAAAASLTQQGLSCVSQSVSIDTSGFASPVGAPATVRASVSCTITAADLGYGIGGDRTYTATAVSALDTYRERR